MDSNSGTNQVESKRRLPLRKRLSVDEKYQICKRLEDGESVISIARNFDIKKNTVWRIKREASSLKNFVENVRVGDHRVRKTIKAPQNQLLERGIFAWFIRRQLAKEQVSGTLLSDKALALNKKIGGAADFAASSGWLHRFKLRHRITFQNLIGGEMLVESLSAVDSRYLIKEIIEKENYNENNIYYLEEAEFAWKNIPQVEAEWTKSRLTVVICHNCAGSHRLPLLVLGKDECCATNPGVLYATQKVRSNMQIMHWYENHFIPSVKEFQTNRKRAGKVLLIIDRSATEAAVEHLNAVDTNFSVLLLPYKTAALAQPLDRCIVANIKCSYRMRFLQHLAKKGDLKSSGEKFQLENCLHMLGEIWSAVSGEEMRSSWNSLWYIGDTDIVSDMYFSPHVSDFFSVAHGIPGYQNLTESDIYAWLNIDNGRDLLLEGEEQYFCDDGVESGVHLDPLFGTASDELRSNPSTEHQKAVDVDHAQLDSCAASAASTLSNNSKTDTKRKRLSLEEKYAICRRLEEGESMESLKQEYNLKQGMLSHIIQNATVVKNFVETAGVSDERVRKSVKQPQNQRVENGVLAWFIRKQLMKQSISWAILCDTALDLNRKIGGNLDFAASSGWQRGFKLRHQIKSQNLQCAELLAESSAALKFRNEIKDIIHNGGYVKENIYTVERTQFAWKILPRCETSGTNIWLTLNLCTNSTGSHKLPILVLGKEDCQEEIESIIYQKHLNKTHTHIVDWYCNVLVKGIKEFQAESGMKGKALFIMDRITSEEVVDQLNKFDEDFHVVLIPCKTAYAVQPQDRSIVLNMKCLYRMSLLEQIQSHDEGSQGIIDAYENFELDDGLQLLSEAWDSLTNEDIEIAWRKLWFVGDGDITDDTNFCPSVSEFKSVLHSVPGHDDCTESDVCVWLNIDSGLGYPDAREMTSCINQISLPEVNKQLGTGTLNVPGTICNKKRSSPTAVTVTNKSFEDVLNVEGMKKKMSEEIRKRECHDLEIEDLHADSQSNSDVQDCEYYESISNNSMDVKVEPQGNDAAGSENGLSEAVYSDVSVSHNTEREELAPVCTRTSKRPLSVSPEEERRLFKKGRSEGIRFENVIQIPSDQEALEACETLLQWISRQNIKGALSLNELHSIILSKTVE